MPRSGARLAALASLALCLALAAHAAAGEGTARLVATDGTPAPGEAAGVHVRPGPTVLLDDAGEVLFASDVYEQDGALLRGSSWFLANRAGVLRRVVTTASVAAQNPTGDAAPPAAESPAVISVAGTTVRSISSARLSRAGRVAFAASLDRSGSFVEALLADVAGTGLRTVAVADAPLPGLACGLVRLNSSAQANSYGIHDGALFLGARFGTESAPWNCAPADANVFVLLGRRGAAAFELLQRAGDTGIDDLAFQFDATFQATLADGATAFLTTVRDGTLTNRSALALYDPQLDGFELLALDGSPMPDTGRTVFGIGTPRVAPRVGALAEPRTAFAVEHLLSEGAAVYEATGATLSRVAAAGDTAGAFTFTGGLASNAQRVEAFPVADGVVFVGAVTGAAVTGSARVGVWRRRTGAALELVAYPGMSFTDGASTFAVEGLVTVMVAPSGGVALEVSYRDGGASRSALLVEDSSSPRRLVTALRTGDTVPTRTGTGRVVGIGNGGTPSFPATFGTGDDGLPARVNDAGEVVVRLNGSSTDGSVATGVYVVTLGTPPQPGAGDLVVRARRGRVKVKGTRGNDALRVEPLGGGMVRLTGSGGTTVGGAASLDVDASRKLVIDLGAGDDAVEFVGSPCPPAAKDDCATVGGALALLLGVGSDEVVARDAAFDAVRIDFGASARGAPDHDALVVDDCEFDALVATGGRGGEVAVTLSAIDLVTLDLVAARGTDLYALSLADSVVHGKAKVNARGAAASDVRVHGAPATADPADAVSGSLDLAGSVLGADFFELLDVRFEDRISVKLGNGTNTFAAAGVACDELRVAGGRDRDDIDLDLRVQELEEQARIRAARIDTKSGDDEFEARISSYSRSQTYEGLAVSCGPGDDTLRVTEEFEIGEGPLLPHGFQFDGGPGTDTLEIASPDPTLPGSVIDDIEKVVTLA